MNCPPVKERKYLHLFDAFAVVLHLVINRKDLPTKWCFKRECFLVIELGGNVILNKYAHRKTKITQSQNKHLKFAKIA